MQFEDTFLHSYYAHCKDEHSYSGKYCPYGEVPQQYFINGIFSILRNHKMLTLPYIKKLSMPSFAITQWGLPASFLIPSDEIKNYPQEIVALYTATPMNILNEKFFVYYMWSIEQVEKFSRWYTQTFFGSPEKRFNARTKAHSEVVYEREEL